MNYETNKLGTFLKRMEKLGIDIELGGNFPWVYITKINGVKVTKILYSDYAFTLGFVPIRIGQDFTFYNIEETFKLIREYVGKTKGPSS